jgi:hypothetical protein
VLAQNLCMVTLYQSNSQASSDVESLLCAHAPCSYSVRMAALGPHADDSTVITSDVKAALADLITSKSSSASPAVQSPQDVLQRCLDISPPEEMQAEAASGPPPAAAPPATPAAAPAQEVVEADKPAVYDGTAAFDGLSPEFLRAMQDGLEAMGFDLTSREVVQVSHTCREACRGDPTGARCNRTA